MERRLAAIVAADVVGYSRMMRMDEEATLMALRRLRADVVDPAVAARRGRIFKEMGDGLLFAFASAVDATSFAVEMQAATAAWNSPQTDAFRIDLRVGVNLGDVIVEGGDIFGDGVNVAARLEGLAEPGGVFISDAVYEQVRDRLDAPFRDLGYLEAKNIDRPIRAWAWDPSGAGAGGDAAAPAPVAAPAPQVPDRPSIAVLPFANMSGDPEQDYFADGMVEDIITGLARLKWLFVIARNSSFAYKGAPVDVKQAGEELGVRYVLEGSVRKAADRVRVTAQLIEAATGRNIWAERYDRTLDDVFALQDELTMTVVAVIEPTLRQAEIDRVKHSRPDSLAAYDLMLQALPHVYTAMPEGAAAALTLLERSLAMEPDYAQAHGFAAWCHEIMFTRDGRRDENRLGALRHAQAAVAYGNDDATALTLGGFVIGLVGHDRAVALQAFESALALSPSCALTYNLGSVVQALEGDAAQAIAWGESALRLSPRDPTNYAPLYAIASGLFQQGDDQAAADAAQKTFQANPYWVASHFMLAAANIRLGRSDAAADAARRVLELQPEFTIGGLIAAFDAHPSIAAPLSEALKAAGLPE